MKKLTKFFMIALLAGMCSLGYAQTQPDYLGDPKLNETVLGKINITLTSFRGKWAISTIYEYTLANAKDEYPNKNLDIRNMSYKEKLITKSRVAYLDDEYDYYVIATVVELPQKSHIAIKKALQNIPEGSRLALDQIRTVKGNNEDFKDQIVEILLDEGYKVVAKDYLEKLYEEQKAQQSGIYNDRTIVKENNFSAVGYYINVKQTETTIKVQVINVSTGEYEANVTVNL